MNALALLQARVAQIGQAATARELGLGRDGNNHTGISLYLRGKYPASTERLELRILTKYARVACPFLAQEIAFAECREHHDREAPAFSQFDMRHWKACQRCPNNKSPRGAL